MANDTAKPPGFSRRNFLRGAGIIAADPKAALVPEASAGDVNKLLAAYMKVCKGSNDPDKNLSSLCNLIDPNHGRIFFSRAFLI